MSGAPPLFPQRFFHEPGREFRALSISAVEAELSHGSHRPLLCQMEGLEGPAGRWIVKPAGRHPHGNLALLRELAGASVAAWVGLLVPAIELIQLPAQPAPAWVDSSLTGRILQEHAGQFAFCSRYLPASRLEQATLLLPENLDSLLMDALCLLMLDVLIWHHDRTPANPNALFLQGRIVAIDHDTAFRDIQALDESTGLGVDFHALSFQETGWGDHLAFPLLRAHTEQAAEAARRVAGRLQTLGDEVLAGWLAQWPDSLERSKIGMPSGYKSALLGFLTARRERARELLDGFLDSRPEFGPTRSTYPPAEEP